MGVPANLLGKSMADKEVELDLYRLSIEQTRDYALFLLDPGGRVITWNLGAQLIKGYAPEEIIGRHFSVFYTPEALETGSPAHELRVAATEGHFTNEGWRVRKDGSRFWASVVVTALRDENGKLVGYLKITRDLTDRKIHDEGLRQSEERLRLLIEGVVDYAIYMLDPQGIVTSWNAGAQRLKGYAREEIIGRHFSRFYTPEDVDAGKPWEVLTTTTRYGHFSEEAWRIRKNGERFWAKVVVTALHDSQGRLRGFAKVTQDLSDRRQIEDLEQAAKNIDEFIATLAHELRNPLAAIRYGVHVIAKAPEGKPTSGIVLQTIERQSAQLSRIVDDMLDISRVRRGTLSIERKPVDLADAVNRAVETAAPLIEAGNHTLAVDVQAGLTNVEGDLQRLTQLVANLLNNAAIYTQPGGSIQVKASAEKGYGVVSVRDNGPGIEADMQDHIFAMFTQGTQRRDRFGAGLGVGLALARKIATLHGGSLEARSEGKNKGSEFIFRLPLLAASMETAPVAANTQHESLVPRRILVVDDNVDGATTLNLLLESLGHETCVVHDGIEALKMAVEFLPDVVLLDIAMPGIDGYEVARRLRELKKDPPLRIVAVTGFGQETDRQKSREAGFDVHLVKPVEVNDLAQALNERGGATLH